MSVTLTAMGSTLDITVLDQNFELVQDLMRAGLSADEITGRFDRYRLFRYMSGKMVSAQAFQNPFRDSRTGLTGTIDRFMLNYVQHTENSGDPTVAILREQGGAMSAHPMELLGRPGGSFYYEFHEEGLQAPDVIWGGPLTGWVPSGYPYSRWPKNRCYSRWLTAPGAAVRVYVPEMCTARVKGHVKASFSAWQMARFWSGVDTCDAAAHRFESLYRWGLVVDTEPNIYTDEFPNANRWIVNSDGSMADFKSWEIIADEPLRMAQREKIDLMSSVSLQGGRWYNFSMRYRGAGRYGWIDQDAGEWVDKIWESCYDSHRGVSNAPILSPYFDGWASSPGTSPEHAFAPPWTALFESCGIEVELYYGMGFTDKIDNDDPDFLLRYEATP